MAGFMDILGTMVQQGMSQSAGSRISNALGGNRSGGGLEDILGGLSSMLGGNSQSGQGSSASALPGILGDVMGSLGGIKNNKMAIGGLGALAGALLSGKGSATRGAIGGGGLAMLASLAFSAMKNAGQAPNKPFRGMLEPETEADRQALDNDAQVIVKAMIAAAKADGRIDKAEMEKIAGKLEAGGLTAEEKQLFLTEAQKPLDINEIIASAQGQPEMGAQIYAASLLAIEVDTPEERQYLDQLASGLGLNSAVVNHIEKSLGVA